MAWKRPDHLSPPGLALGTSLGTRTTLVLLDFSVSWLPCSLALPLSPAPQFMQACPCFPFCSIWASAMDLEDSSCPLIAAGHSLPSNDRELLCLQKSSTRTHPLHLEVTAYTLPCTLPSYIPRAVVRGASVHATP